MISSHFTESQPSLPEGAAAAAPVAAPVPETTEAEIYVYLEIALEAITVGCLGKSAKISKDIKEVEFWGHLMGTYLI